MLLVGVPVDGRGCGPARIGLDLRGRAKLIGDEGAQPIGIISGIGDDVADTVQVLEQHLGPGAVAILTRGRMDAQRQAERIDHGVQFGGHLTNRVPRHIEHPRRFPLAHAFCASLTNSRI